MTSEEFFMYLIIGLIVVVPLAARLYRRATLHRTTGLLRTQIGSGVHERPHQTSAQPRQRAE